VQPADAAVAEVAGLCGYCADRLVAGFRHHPAWTVTTWPLTWPRRGRLAALQAEDVSSRRRSTCPTRLTAGQQRCSAARRLANAPTIDAMPPRPG